jgi:Ca2+-binding RTX toxin-like protein
VQQFNRPFDLNVVFNRFAIQGDDRIVFADDVSLNTIEHNFTAVRANADGTADLTYGDNGVATTAPLTGITVTPSHADAFLIDDQGRAVAIIGNGREGDRPSIMVRFNSDGTVDSTVGPGDAQALDISAAVSAALQSDGKIVVGSYPYTVSRILDIVEDVALVGGTLFIRGTSAADTITIAKTGSNIVVTRNGTDTTFAASDVQKLSIDALAGDDVVTVSVDLPALVDGRDGNNKITTAAGADTITTGAGRDTISSGDGADRITSGGGNDSITSGDAGDLTSGVLPHIIDAGDGNDTVVTGFGRDTITGGGGNNHIVTGGYYDEIFCESESTPAGDNFVQCELGLIQCGDGDDTIVGGNGGVFGDQRGNEIHAGAGNNVITSGSSGDTIDSGGGNDSISSGGGRDIINSADGNDTIDAGDGDDDINTQGNLTDGTGAVITAGDGNDDVTSVFAKSVDGGAGDDRITGRDNIPTVHGGDGNDLVRVNSDATHSAVVFGGDGNDSIYTSDGRDLIYGGAGNDRVHAGLGSDLISGGGGHDVLFGQGGNDRLYGGAGVDRLEGQHGNDRLDGGAGDDTIAGGPGTDTSLASDVGDILTSIEVTSA